MAFLSKFKRLHNSYILGFSVSHVRDQARDDCNGVLGTLLNTLAHPWPRLMCTEIRHLIWRLFVTDNKLGITTTRSIQCTASNNPSVLILYIICRNTGIRMNHWGVRNIGYRFKTHLRPKSTEISSVFNICYSCPIVFKFCSKHDNDALPWIGIDRLCHTTL